MNIYLLPASPYLPIGIFFDAELFKKVVIDFLKQQIEKEK